MCIHVCVCVCVCVCVARIAPYMNIQKQRTIIKSFVTSQFSYCPLIRMFHTRRLINN